MFVHACALRKNYYAIVERITVSKAFDVIRMKTKHVFALIALILGIIGGVLLCKSALDALTKILEGRGHFNVTSLALAAIGIIAIIASVMIWRGSYLTGGVINIVLGIITVFYGRDTEGLIVLISGVLGIVAPRVKG